MIWLYAICDRPEAPPPLGEGLAGAAVESVRSGPLLAVFSRHDDVPVDPALEALQAHERVVEQLMADRAVLPMRFGTRLAGDEAVAGALDARRDEFLAGLDRVRGRVEVGVRALQPRGEAPPPPATTRGMTGREYIEAKLRRGRAEERDVALLHEPLAELAVAARRRPTRTPGELLRAAYLVESADLPRFRTAVEQLQGAHAGLAILCTGPWPAYSFVGDDLAVAA